MKIYVLPTDTTLGLACDIDDHEAYSLLYKMKARDSEKPISLLVRDWEELEEETTLNTRQIDFLKSYKFPFTVVTNVREDFRVEYDLDEDIYEQVGFRVGEACLEDQTLNYIHNTMFLTSANKSWEEECETIEEVKDVFWKYDKYLKILPGNVYNNEPSNVIRFVGDSTELEYIRKNYP